MRTRAADEVEEVENGKNNWLTLKYVLCTVPELRRFSDRYIGLLYWILGIIHYYEGCYIAAVERRGADEDGEEIDYLFEHRFFLYKGLARGFEIDVKYNPHIIIQNGKDYLFPYLPERDWGVVMSCYPQRGLMLQRTRNFYCCWFFSNINYYFHATTAIRIAYRDNYHKISCINIVTNEMNVAFGKAGYRLHRLFEYVILQFGERVLTVAYYLYTLAPEFLYHCLKSDYWDFDVELLHDLVLIFLFYCEDHNPTGILLSKRKRKYTIISLLKRIEKKLEWKTSIEGENDFIYMYRTQEICLYKNCKKSCTKHLNEYFDEYKLKKYSKKDRLKQARTIPCNLDGSRQYHQLKFTTKFSRSRIDVITDADYDRRKYRYVNFVLPYKKKISDLSEFAVMDTYCNLIKRKCIK